MYCATFGDETTFGGGYLPFDSPEVLNFMMNTETPEDILLKKERMTMIEETYLSMSDEAKQVIDIILDRDGQFEFVQSIQLNVQKIRVESSEEKQIASILFNIPLELLKIFFTPKGKKMKDASGLRTRLLTVLGRQWQDRRYANQVLNEVESFVKLI